MATALGRHHRRRHGERRRRVVIEVRAVSPHSSCGWLACRVVPIAWTGDEQSSKGARQVLTVLWVAGLLCYADCQYYRRSCTRRHACGAGLPVDSQSDTCFPSARNHRA